MNDDELELTGRKFGMLGLTLKYSKKYNRYIVTFRREESPNVKEFISIPCQLENPECEAVLCKMKLQIMIDLHMCGYIGSQEP